MIRIYFWQGTRRPKTKLNTNKLAQKKIRCESCGNLWVASCLSGIRLEIQRSNLRNLESRNPIFLLPIFSWLNYLQGSLRSPNLWQDSLKDRLQFFSTHFKSFFRAEFPVISSLWHNRERSCFRIIWPNECEWHHLINWVMAEWIYE